MSVCRLRASMAAEGAASTRSTPSLLHRATFHPTGCVQMTALKQAIHMLREVLTVLTNRLRFFLTVLLGELSPTQKDKYFHRYIKVCMCKVETKLSRGLRGPTWEGTSEGQRYGGNMHQVNSIHYANVLR